MTDMCRADLALAIFSQAGKKSPELLEKVLKMFPPVMHMWFARKFSEPVSWHNARLAFTRTTAVWSMVGHMVGLGDRHGENILLDSGSGDIVHVDFSCLFDKVW
jgi:serine/threonine-protein kinase ATR